MTRYKIIQYKKFLPSYGFIFILITIVIILGFGHWIAKDYWYEKPNTTEFYNGYSNYLIKLSKNTENVDEKERLLSLSKKYKSKINKK